MVNLIYMLPAYVNRSCSFPQLSPFFTIFSGNSNCRCSVDVRGGGACKYDLTVSSTRGYRLQHQSSVRKSCILLNDNRTFEVPFFFLVRCFSSLVTLFMILFVFCRAARTARIANSAPAVHEEHGEGSPHCCGLSVQGHGSARRQRSVEGGDRDRGG